MNILGAIFGSKKNTENLVDAGISGIDKMFYTDEEKSQDMAKMREWFLRYLEATQPQNLARRLIAVAVVALWCALILLAVALWQWFPAWSDYTFEVLRDAVLTPFNIIIGFYFAAHIVRQIPRKGQ